MAKHGKRYLDAVKKVEKDTLYDTADAVRLVKELANAKFDETIDLAFRLGIDPRHADQQVRGAVVLPHGTGKSRSVLVFAKGPKVQEAQEVMERQVDHRHQSLHIKLESRQKPLNLEQLDLANIDIYIYG